jgi:alpha-ketoglutarate-dependent taurine dioxygenase
MTYRHIRVEPLSPHVGAEIGGVDISVPVSDEVQAEIRDAFGRYGVVFFRDQKLTPEQHVAVAGRFGPINVNRFFATVPGHPMIAEVRKEPDQTRNIGGGWHTDHSYDEAPALGSMLYAREVPATGGDTLFASMYAAYDALSDGLKATLDGLWARHSAGTSSVPRRWRAAAI